ncbi:MAG: cytochrome b/b6 domain-containing protein [Alphaproteobacteria bacterium]|jgi:cytochrome b|nr:cytochrome b/b6 domain-containing protein [Alphaproteobacteria bacterium]
MALRAYTVWDRPTRLFHWINLATVLGLAGVGLVILNNKVLGVSPGGKVLLKTVHVWLGYLFVINLAWRLLWAFLGNRFARWSAILPVGAGSGARFRAYLRGFAAGDPPRYLGHNPLARLMVSLLLAMLLAQGATGLVLAGTDLYFPPLGHWIATWVAAPGIDPAALVPGDESAVDPDAWAAMRAFRSPFIAIHYWGFYLLCAAIVAHVAGVVAAERREGGALVSAMITGRKLLDRAPVDAPETGSEPGGDDQT